MKFNGDIKVWVDETCACAQLTAVGPDGPIVVRASAPLATVRKQVARALARRGHQVSGMEVGFTSLVRRIARRKALGRLMRLAPRALSPGGAAARFAARQVLSRVRRRRRSAPPVPGPADEEDPGEGAAEDGGEPADGGDVEEEVGRAFGCMRMGAEAKAALKVTAQLPQVQAASRLLSAARSRPAALKKVFRIASLARAGSPKARTALKALKVASKLRKTGIQQALVRATPQGAAAAMLLKAAKGAATKRRGVLALPALGPRPGPVLTIRPRGIFWAWDPDVLRRRRG
jgi:hypothetical protein